MILLILMSLLKTKFVHCSVFEAKTDLGLIRGHAYTISKVMVALGIETTMNSS